MQENIGLAFRYAESYCRRNTALTMDDLLQAGYMGLIMAADRFDPGKGYRFSTYAMYWIRKYVRLEVLAHDGRGVAKRGDVENFLMGRMSDEDARHFMEATTRPASLRYEQDDDQQDEWLISTEERGIEDAETRIGFEQCVNAMLDVCSWDECMAVWMSYGVAGMEKTSNTRIAKELGAGSAKEVREMIQRALRKVGRVID